MASGYVRQSAGQIVTGNTIQASDFNNEYTAIANFADGTAGHDHSGGVGLGPKLNLSTATTGTLPIAQGGTGQTTASTALAALLAGSIIGPGFGGTGVNNGTNTITIAGNLTHAGAFTQTFTATGNTSVTLPTSGTLVGSADIGTVTNTMLAGSISNAKLAGGITASNLVLTDITALTGLTTASSLASVGTITTGVWHGTVIGSTYGGTGVNNGTNTITLGGNLTTSGAFNTTLTVTGATNVTLPTTGTLVNTAVTTLSSLASVGTITTGVWSGTTIAVNKGGTGLTTLTANNVILGAGTSTPTFVAPGTSGNILTSDGTTWNSAPNAAAPLASPAFTGTPTAPTATLGTNTTQIATTAFVLANASTIKKFTSSGNTFSANSVSTIAHGFGTVPLRAFLSIVNVTAESGYSTGDELQIEGVIFAASSGFVPEGFLVLVDSTNITVRCSALPLNNLPNKTTFASSSGNPANWTFTVKAIG